MADRLQNNLLNFLNSSPWDDTKIRSFAAGFALEEIQKQESPEAYVIDDTGFLKQGTESVGVQRQYTGTAGKIAHSQVAVSLTLTTASTHLPLDMALYLPVSWTKNKERRAKAKIPDEILFRTKHQIALDLVATTVEQGRPKLPVLADAA